MAEEVYNGQSKGHFLPALQVVGGNSIKDIYIQLYIFLFISDHLLFYCAGNIVGPRSLYLQSTTRLILCN